MNLALIIQGARTAKKISQSALSRRIGIHNQTVSDIERGKRNVPPKYADDLARELDLDVEQLRAAMMAFSVQGDELGNAEPK